MQNFLPPQFFLFLNYVHTVGTLRSMGAAWGCVGRAHESICDFRDVLRIAPTVDASQSVCDAAADYLESITPQC